MMDKVYLFFRPLTVSSGREYCFNARTEKHKTCNYPAVFLKSPLFLYIIPRAENEQMFKY